MRTNGSAHPEQLAVLHQIFERRCLAASIEPGDPHRENLAQQLMHLFESGVQSAEELEAALDSVRSRQIMNVI